MMTLKKLEDIIWNLRQSDNIADRMLGKVLFDEVVNWKRLQYSEERIVQHIALITNWMERSLQSLDDQWTRINGE